MAEVIAFPQRVETKTLHLDEKHAFGEIGGLMLSLVQAGWPCGFWQWGMPTGPSSRCAVTAPSRTCHLLD
jgi:hypothetical protein